MKLRSLRVEEQPQLMIIPMIDIIFFLLIFFMMSTLYMVEQHTIPVNLPQSAVTAQDTERNITVTVTATGRILFNDEELPVELLKQRVSAELAGGSDRVFVLRADKQVEYGKVITVLDQLKMAGAKRVAVAAEVKS